MKFKFQSLVVVVSLCLLAVSFSACKGGGSAQDKLIGQWAGDVEAMKKQDPEIEKNPMAAMLFGILSGMKVEFTSDTMNVEVMGQEQSVKFKIVASDSNSVTLEATEGENVGKKNIITFIDNNHIKMQEEGDEGPAMVLKRQ